MYNTDTPIKSQSDDLLGRKNFAKDLARAIIRNQEEETLCIGIFGKWGSGKTSILNMMQEEIHTLAHDLQEAETPLLISFDPWNFTSTNQLIQQFFIRLINTFRNDKDKKVSGIGKKLHEYSNAFSLAEFIPSVGPLISGAGKFGLEALGKYLDKDPASQDISEQKQRVIEALRESKRRIVIIIDDIDRLSNEQIRQVFQLVNAVAHFPNTTYLLSFDREIVTNALEEVQGGNGNEYLEKIIQLPIHIPDIADDCLNSVLLTRLNEVLEQSDPRPLFWDVRWRELFESSIKPYIHSLRDINRLNNLVRFKLLSISSEIEFSNMVAISALELFRPSVFAWIKENKPLLTGEHNFDFNRNKTAQQKKEEAQKELIDYIHHHEKRIADQTEIEQIFKSLAILFPYFGHKIGLNNFYRSNDEMIRNDQVSCADKFDRYFSLDIDSVPLRRGELRYALEAKSEGELQDFYIQEAQNGLGETALRETQAYIPVLSESRIHTVIIALFEVSFQMDRTSGLLFVPNYVYATYMIRDLLEKLPTENRMPLLKEIIKNASINSLQTFASFLNTTELAFGKFSEEGEDRDIKKTILPEQLPELESLFICRVKELWEIGENPLLWSNGHQVIYLMEKLDEDFTRDYMKRLLTSDENILRYIDYSVSKWTGSGIMYEVKDTYKVYLSEEDCAGAFERMSEDGSLYALPAEIQEKAAALYLAVTEPQKYKSREIYPRDIQALLNSRKAQLIASKTEEC